jgi:hypothetical protein
MGAFFLRAVINGLQLARGLLGSRCPRPRRCVAAPRPCPRRRGRTWSACVADRKQRATIWASGSLIALLMVDLSFTEKCEPPPELPDASTVVVDEIDATICLDMSEPGRSSWLALRRRPDWARRQQHQARPGSGPGGIPGSGHCGSIRGTLRRPLRARAAGWNPAQPRSDSSS